MESIVKMGVKTARDSRNEDAVQAGQNTGPGVDRLAGESGKTAGTDYNYSSTGIPGVSYPYGAASTSGAGSAARRSNPAYGTTAGGSLDGKAADGITGKVKADGSAKAGEGTAESQKRAEKKTADSERVLMHRQRRQYRMIAAYAVATVVISYVLLHMANNLGDILKMAGKAAQTIGMLLAPLFWGFVVAYILSPAVEFFENRFQNRGLFKRNLHKRRGIAVAVTYLLAILFLGALLSIVASALSKSLRIASLEDLVIMIETLAGTLKSFQRSIQDWLVKMNLSSNEVATALSDVGESVASFTSGLSKSVTGTITQIGGLLTSSIFVIIFSIYFLLDKEGIERYWKRVVTAVGGRNARHYCKIIVEDADTVFSGYIRGQLIDALIMAILVSTSLYLIGIKYAVIIGILSGIGNLIPYLGPVVAYGSTILVSLLSGDWKRMIVALVVLFIIQTIDGNVINPKLLSSSIDVHPMLVIAALIIGGALGGFLGMLFAVPVAAFLKVQFDKIIWRLIRIRTPELAIETKPGVTPEKKTDSRAAGGGEAAAAKTGKTGSKTGSSGAGRSGAKASSANHGKSGAKASSATPGKSGAKAGTSGAGKSTVRTAAADVEKSSVRAGSLNTGKALATGTVTTAAKTGTAVPARSGAKAGTAGRTKKSAAGTAGTLKEDREKIKKGKRKTGTKKS